MNQSPVTLKYDDVINHIIRNIRLGIYPDQSKLPSEKVIAEALGVSVTTVRGGLKQLCERNIIIKQQGRRSIVNAAAIRGSSQTLRIGWISRDDFTRMNPVYFEIYNRTLSYLFQTNFHLTFLPFLSHRDEQNILRLFDSFDGFILAGIRMNNVSDELAQSLHRLKNVIEIDNVGVSPANYTVCTDNYSGGVMLGEYLAVRKRRCPVLFLTNKTDYYPAFNMRNRGIIDGLSAAQMKFVLAPGDMDIENDAEMEKVVADLLERYPHIDTIWHPSDQRGIAIRKIFERVKGGEPGYFRSCGVDGLPEVIETDDFHASARHPFEDIARTTVEVLLNSFSGTLPEDKGRKICPTLIPWKK